MLSGLALYRPLFSEPYGSKPGFAERPKVQCCRTIRASRFLLRLYWQSVSGKQHGAV